MGKIKGCIVNKKATRVIMETIRNDTSLDGSEVMKLTRVLSEKCNKNFRGA